MSGKKGFIHRHILDADDSFSRFQFQDAIHKEERGAVRQDLLYFVYIQGHYTPISHSRQCCQSSKLGGRQKITASPFQTGAIKSGSQLLQKKSRSLALLGMTSSFKDDVILTTNGRKDLLFRPGVTPTSNCTPSKLTALLSEFN